MTTVTSAITRVGDSRRPVPVHLALDTPGLLRLMLGGTWALAALFALAASVGIDRHRQAVQTIGHDAAPSIIAAQRIRASFAWAHVDAVRGLRGLADTAAAYDEHRRAAADGLVSAAENITYGDAERAPIRQMVDGFGRYGAAVARARVLTGAGATAALADADRILHADLLPAADALDLANREALNRAYSAQRDDATWGLAWTSVAGIALLAGLVGVQAFLTRRTRRLLNPALIVATALTCTMLAWLLAAMASSADDLRTAKADAFDSVSALCRARAVGVDGFAANLAGFDARRAVDDATCLAAAPPGATLEDVANATERSGVPTGFTGFLADELRNITFPGEREAAIDALRSFDAYQSAGGSDATLFARFDDALGRTLAVNQQAFDGCVAQGFAALDGLSAAAATTAVAVAVAAYIGLRPRLKEYAA